MEISRPDEVDQTLSGIAGTSKFVEQISLPEDPDTSILSGIDQYLESKST